MPAAFSSKYVTSSYKNKGQASKTFRPETNEWRYDVVFGKFQMFGEEGAVQGLKQVLDRKETSKDEITPGERCVVQDDNYERGTRLGTVPDSSKSRAKSDTMAAKRKADETPEDTSKRLKPENNEKVHLVVDWTHVWPADRVLGTQHAAQSSNVNQFHLLNFVSSSTLAWLFRTLIFFGAANTTNLSAVYI